MPETPREELARRLAQFPQEALSYFKGGFGAAATLSDSTRDQVLQEVINNFSRGTRRLDGSIIRPIAKLSERDSEQVASVYSLVIGLLSESSAMPEDFVNAARNILFSPDHETTARSIANAICVARANVKTSVDRAQLAGEVLPSLDEISVAVDMRFRIIDAEVKLSVPIALLHIDTDANEELWVQLTRGDVEDTIEKLSKCLEDMKLIETLSFRKS
jgi:hypothetical protein